jgi:hypothetical protein
MSALDQTSHAADRVRSELLDTLHELDRRRRSATDLRHQVQTHKTTVMGLGAAAGVGLVGIVTALLMRRRHRRIEMSTRIRAFRRAWEHPNRIATRAKDRPLPTELGRKVLMAVLVTAATRFARLGVDRVFTRATAPRRLA